MEPVLRRVTIEYEWDVPGENRPFTRLRYDFTYPEVRTARFSVGLNPTHSRYELDVHSPIARPIITETTEHD
jgi:hypothetical protein